jgi:hypothetical protein
MKLWKQLSRKLEGWVERKRRFQQRGDDRSLALAGQKAPLAQGATAPVSVPESGKAR